MQDRCDGPLLRITRYLRNSTPWVALLACLSAAVVAWYQENANEARRREAALGQRAAVLATALQERLGRYEGLVSAARAALPNAGPAGEDALRRFVTVEDVSARYPGIAGFGLVVTVPAADVGGFTTLRTVTQPDFHITPKAGGEARPPDSPAYVVVQAFPAVAAGMVGYDLATDQTRRQTAEQARDSGRVALSRRLTLLSPGASGNDVLMMAAVYRGGVVPPTVDERRAALAGWVVAALRMGPVADSLLSGQTDIDLILTDITGGRPGIPVYERRGLMAADEDTSTITRTIALHIGERVWEVRFTALAADGGNPASGLILAGGTGVGFLLWGGLSLLAAGRRTAEDEARRTADTLSRTEATYRRFIASTAEGYIEVDGDGRIIDVNDALCRILERPRDALVGTPLLDLATNSSRAVIAHHLTSRTIGDQRCYDATLRGGNGGRVNLRINATTATAGPSGGRLHSFALMTDVTAQTRLQEQMHAAQMRLEQIFAAAPIAMAVVRLDDGMVVQANRSASTLFGPGSSPGPAADGEPGAAQTLSGHNFLPYIANAEDARALMAAVRTSGNVRGFEVRMMHPDGTTWWAMLAAARFLHGGDLAMLVGCQNIDAVKKGQEAQRLAAAILESVRDGVMVLSLDHHIEQVNPAFTWITGYSAADAVGQTPGLLESGGQADSLYDAVWAGVGRDGFWSGDLWLRRRSGEAFVSSTSVTPIRPGGGAPTHYVAVMHDITARKEDEDRNWKLANYDPLTGLPNRLLFADRLSQAVGHAQRAGGRFALLYLDLDGFKPINDRWGHGAGDQVLQETAVRLLACVRGSDTVARVGGDEFIIILADAQDRTAARTVAQKIVGTLSRPITLTTADGRVEGTVTASIGMAVYAADGSTPEAMVAAADAAMYHAKAKGKNRCTFSPQVEAEMG